MWNFIIEFCCLEFTKVMVVSFYWLILQLLIKLEDNRLIETVGIPVQDEKGLMRLTACVSSQVIFKDRVLSLTKFPHCSYVLMLALEFQCTVHYSNCFSCVAYFEWVKQVGCPLRCSFCATGKGGFSRNLKRHEIIEQVWIVFSMLYLQNPFWVGAVCALPC